MSKNAYWRKREEEQLKHYISDEREIQRAMAEIYEYMLRQIEVQINDFYARYARRENITLAEAMQRVSKMDVQAFAEKAKKYVKEKNFSGKANRELRLYNATMRINRLELLKANIGLEMIDGFNELEKTLDSSLTKRTVDELKRQDEILRRDAGILSTTVFDNAKTARTIVNASFNNATWSERIWGNQSKLRDELSSLLTQGLIQGKNPNALAPSLQKLFGVSRNSAERLMVTEMARVQTDAQMESFKENDIDEYIFLSLDTACKECMALNEKHFPVKDMEPGENAPPVHPRCRCSTAAYVDREALERELFGEEARQVGLSAGGSASSEIPKHDPPEYVRKLVDGEDRRRVLLEYEKLIADEEIENAIVITKNGEIYRCRGSLNGVYPDVDLGDKLIGADVTHNHPKGSKNEYTFSGDDLRLFDKYQLNSLRGIDELFQYELNRCVGDVDKQVSIFDIDEYTAQHSSVIDYALKNDYGYRRKQRAKG